MKHSSSNSKASLPHALILRANYVQSGDLIEGKLNSDFLKISDFQPTTPLSYQLTVTFDKDEILVYGQLQLSGTSPCARCLIDFPIELRNNFSVSLKKQDTIDLTEALKEDILLALPAYPKCELDEKFRCPITGKNWKAVWQSTEASPPLNNQWSKLDKIKEKLESYGSS